MDVQSRPFACLRSVAVLLPLLSGACASEQGGLDLFPLYRNQQFEDRGEFSILWPLSSFEWDQDGEHSWIIPPLYSYRRALDFESTSWFPLYSRTTVGARTDSSLLSVLITDLVAWASYEGEPDLAALSVFPLFQWRKEGAGTRLSFLRVLELAPTGPAVSLLDIDRTGLSFSKTADRPALSLDVASVFGRIINLFHYDDEGSHSDLRLLTLFANEDLSLFQYRWPHEAAGATSEIATGRTILFPLYFDIQHDARTRTRIFWPFYGSTVRGDQAIGRYILFPLLRLRDDPERELSGFDFLWPLIGREQTPQETTTWFQPLFKFIGFEDGYEWTVALNMFGYGRNGERSRIRLFWFPWEL